MPLAQILAIIFLFLLGAVPLFFLLKQLIFGDPHYGVDATAHHLNHLGEGNYPW